MKTKIFVETSFGRFTVNQAAEKFSLESFTIRNRIKAGWSGDEVCGIKQRFAKPTDFARQSYVYGWWSRSLGRYIYVGLTTRSVKIRTQRHYQAASSGETTPLHALIRENGRGDFDVHTLWSGPLSEVQERERFFIALHKTLIEHGGCNYDVGGGAIQGKGNSVVYNGTSYPSIVAVWWASDKRVPLGTFRKAVWQGATIEEALTPKPHAIKKSVIHDGVEYTSRKEAYNTLSDGSVSYWAFKQRMTKGWSFEKALFTPPEENRIAIAIKVGEEIRKYATYRDAWRELGGEIKYETFVYRMNRSGMTPEAALELAKGESTC
jgi:hypothetical protein